MPKNIYNFVEENILPTCHKAAGLGCSRNHRLLAACFEMRSIPSCTGLFSCNIIYSCWCQISFFKSMMWSEYILNAQSLDCSLRLHPLKKQQWKNCISTVLDNRNSWIERLFPIECVNLIKDHSNCHILELQTTF